MLTHLHTNFTSLYVTFFENTPYYKNPSLYKENLNEAQFFNFDLFFLETTIPNTSPTNTKQKYSNMPFIESDLTLGEMLANKKTSKYLFIQRGQTQITRRILDFIH